MDAIAGKVKLGPGVGLREAAADAGVLYWLVSRFMPGAGTVYPTLGAVPLIVIIEAEYLDASFRVIGTKQN